MGQIRLRILPSSCEEVRDWLEIEVKSFYASFQINDGKNLRTSDFSQNYYSDRNGNFTLNFNDTERMFVALGKFSGLQYTDMNYLVRAEIIDDEEPSLGIKIVIDKTYDNRGSNCFEFSDGSSLNVPTYSHHNDNLSNFYLDERSRISDFTSDNNENSSYLNRNNSSSSNKKLKYGFFISRVLMKSLLGNKGVNVSNIEKLTKTRVYVGRKSLIVSSHVSIIICGKQEDIYFACKLLLVLMIDPEKIIELKTENFENFLETSEIIYFYQFIGEKLLDHILMSQQDIFSTIEENTKCNIMVSQDLYDHSNLKKVLVYTGDCNMILEALKLMFEKCHQIETEGKVKDSYYLSAYYSKYYLNGDNCSSADTCGSTLSSFCCSFKNDLTPSIHSNILNQSTMQEDNEVIVDISSYSLASKIMQTFGINMLMFPFHFNYIQYNILHKQPCLNEKMIHDWSIPSRSYFYLSEPLYLSVFLQKAKYDKIFGFYTQLTEFIRTNTNIIITVKPYYESGGDFSENTMDITGYNVELNGSGKQIWQALFCLILFYRAIIEFDEKMFQVETIVPGKAIGKIIGKKGQVVKNIQEISKARIELPKKRQGGLIAPLIISGGFVAIQVALLRILYIVRKCEKELTDTWDSFNQIPDVVATYGHDITETFPIFGEHDENNDIFNQ